MMNKTTVVRIALVLFAALLLAGGFASRAQASPRQQVVSSAPARDDLKPGGAELPSKPMTVPQRPNANVYCVSTGGGATGSPCTNATAYTDIQAAISAASNGDEIRLASGNYPAIGTANVTVNKNITITGGYPGGPTGWLVASNGYSSLIYGQVIVTGGTTATLGNIQIVGGGIANSGTVKIESGFIVYMSIGGTTSGNFTLDANATLQYISGNHSLNNATFSGAGLVQISETNLLIGGNVSVKNLKLISGTLGGNSPSTLTIPSGGVFDWFGGTHLGNGITNISNGATLNLGGVSVGHLLQQRTLTNNGTINMNGTGQGYLGLADGATINNGTAPNSTAQFNIQNDDSVLYSQGAAPVFNNYGTIRKAAGQFASIFLNGFVVLNNNGAVRAESGTLSLDSFSTDIGASLYNVTVGARLRFNGNTHNISPSSTCTIAGTLEFASGTINIACAFNATGTVLSTGGQAYYTTAATIATLGVSPPATYYIQGTINVGTLNWDGGTIQCPIPGTMNVSTAINIYGVQTTKVLDACTINNNGIANVYTTGVGAVVMLNGAVFNNNNHAEFNFNNNDSVVYGGGALPTFNNNLGAILRKKAGFGVTTLSNGFMRFNNAGTVDVITGTLSLDGGASPGSVNSHTGVFKVEQGALLRFGYNSNNASVNNLLDTSHLTGPGNVEIASGIMTTAGEYNITGITYVTGGVVNFDAAIARSGSVNLVAGSISGSGILSVALNFNWTGGTMTSEPGLRARTDLGATGVLNLAGVSSSKYLVRRVFNNYGTTFMNTTGVGALLLGDNAEFNNYNVYDITNNDSVIYLDGPQSAFNNYKTLRKSGGAGISVLGNGNLSFNNTRSGQNVGSVEVVTGTLSLEGGGIDTGSFLVDVTVGSARLRFNGGTHTLQTGSSVTGPGDVEFSFGAANFAGVYNITGETRITGGTANFNHDVNARARILRLVAGTLAGDGALNVTELLDWTGGVMDGAGATLSTTNVATAATLNIRGVATSKSLTARTLNNNGAAFMNGTGQGVMLLGNGATFNNNGTLDIQNDDSIAYLGGTLSHIRNTGTLTKSVGAGITTLGNGQVDFNNLGTVTVVTGTISLDGGGTDTGAFYVNNLLGPARLRFNGGTHTLQSTSSVTGPGDVEFSAGIANFSGRYAITGRTLITGGTVGFNQGVRAEATLVNFTAGTLTGNGTFNVAPNGTFNWNGGTMDGAGAITSTTTISTGATLNLGGVGTTKALLARTLNNYGRTVMNGTGQGVLSMGNGARFNNTNLGTFAIQNDDSVVFAGGTAATFNNFGNFQKADGNGISTVGVDSLAFNNNGTVQVNSGVVNFARNFVQGEDGATFLNGGDLLTGSVIEFAGGTLTGSGAITGTVSNSGGEIAPSGPTSNGSQLGLITINGNYSQGDHAAIRIQLGGTNPGVSYDKVRVLGNATLTGTLGLSLVNGFTPAVGQSFTPFTYANRQDTAFGTISGLNIGGRSFAVSYNPTDLTLTVVNGNATPTPTPGGATATPTVTGTPPTATPTVTGGCNISFSDVTPDNTFYTFVTHLACRGIISGYADGTFRPGNNATRGQLSKIVVVAMGWPLVTPTTPHFSDVTSANAFFTFIETAYEHGIISGYSDGTFKWGNNVTRGQLSKIIVGALGWTLNCPQTATFNDVSTSNPFFCQIETAYEHQIISGYSCTGGGPSCLEFRPNNNATRGQISKIVDLALNPPLR